MSNQSIDSASTTRDQARCPWAGQDPLYRGYHDHEWGRPVDNDTRLFEKICLEGFQSGLSWITILRKRENFRAAFHGFDIARVATMGEPDIDRLLADTGIVRHLGKIIATIHNAGRALELQREFGSLAAYFWRFETRPEQPARRFELGGLAPDRTDRRFPRAQQGPAQAGLQVCRAYDVLRLHAGQGAGQ
jgi:DNA-3-methyladenine glycosylase I